jgi:hypothetical protein
VGGEDVFALRIIPGLLEASMPLNLGDARFFLGGSRLRATIRNAIRNAAGGMGPTLLRLLLKDRRLMGSVANLVKGKSRLASLSPRTAGKVGGCPESEVL